jgi:uncharacterized protein YprB with RNaseH-like and TPR domain
LAKLTEDERIENERQRWKTRYDTPRDLKKEYYRKGIDTIGYFDIETSHLKGNMGEMLSWSMVYRDTQTDKTWVEYDAITRKDVDTAYRKNDPNFDRAVVKSAVEAIQDVQLVIGHYFNGPRKMDMPFLRSRAEFLKIKFPHYQKFRFMDTWGKGRALYSLTSNRLGVFGDMFGSPEEKTPVNFDTWRLAKMGHPKAMKYVVEHNIKDVWVTHNVHKGMEHLLPIPNSYI